MRLDALLSRYGYCSRREAPGWIKRHSITSGGSASANPADKVQAEDVLIDGEPVEFPEGLYAALHKPAGYTCSHDEEEGDVIYDLLPSSGDTGIPPFPPSDGWTRKRPDCS